MACSPRVTFRPCPIEDDDPTRARTLAALVVSRLLRGDGELNVKRERDPAAHVLHPHLDHVDDPGQIVPDVLIGLVHRSAKANKGSGRGKTLDTLLSEALCYGDKSEVKRFFTDLCHRLTNSNLMPCFARAAIQILTFVNKADQNIRDDLAWIIYMIEVRMKYMGRGIPFPFDVELSISAKETAEEKRRKGTCPRTSLVDGEVLGRRRASASLRC